MRRAVCLCLLLPWAASCSSNASDPSRRGDAGGDAGGEGGGEAGGEAGGIGGASQTGTGAGGAGGAASSAGGSPDGGSTAAHNPLSQTLINEFVTAHNAARSGPLDPTPSPALPPVTWDAVLADTAFGYLSRCVATSTPPSLVDHNANRSADYAALGGSGYVGENIYASTGTATPTAAVSSWMSEAPQFIYASSAIGTAGHYTQVVWRASVRIGCAIVNCPAVTFHDTVLCDYAPGGNIVGQKPY
jgi:pathogenesis-related protein 1